jgi:hypothetical protein
LRGLPLLIVGRAGRLLRIVRVGRLRARRFGECVGHLGQRFADVFRQPRIFGRPLRALREVLHAGLGGRGRRRRLVRFIAGRMLLPAELRQLFQ